MTFETPGTLRTGLGFALGTLHFGTATDERESFAILDRFVDAGGTLLDTADCYTFWVPGGVGDESETVIGRWLRSRGARDRVVIGTKVGALPRENGDREGLSAATIRDAVRGSLRRLGTDHVEVYWAHVEDRAVAPEETVTAFDELVRAGTVGVVGASNLPTWRLDRARSIAAARGLTPYTQVQLRHTYLRPRPGTEVPVPGHVLAGDDMLQYVAEEDDLTLWAYNPLLFGAYTRADREIPEVYHHPGTTGRLAAARAVAAELGATLNQVVLAWLMAEGVVPIVGVSRMAHVAEAIGAADLRLDGDLKARLDEPR